MARRTATRYNTMCSENLVVIYGCTSRAVSIVIRDVMHYGSIQHDRTLQLWLVRKRAVAKADLFMSTRVCETKINGIKSNK